MSTGDRGHACGGHLRTRSNPCSKVVEEACHEKNQHVRHQEKEKDGDTILNLIYTLQELLVQLGARQEDPHHARSMDGDVNQGRREEEMFNQDVTIVGHMRDLLRTHSPTYDGSSNKI